MDGSVLTFASELSGNSNFVLNLTDIWTLITKHFSHWYVVCIDVFLRWCAVGSLVNNSLMESAQVLLTHAQWNNWNMTVALEFIPFNEKSELLFEYSLDSIPTSGNKTWHFVSIICIVTLLHLLILSVEFDRAFASLNEDLMKSCDIRGVVSTRMLSQAFPNFWRRVMTSCIFSLLGIFEGMMDWDESVLLSEKFICARRENENYDSA